MNVRKPTDYSTLFAALDELVAEDLPQMELYCDIGRLVSSRSEKGAAVAAAEYLHSTYPDAAGFSPRNLRRMREFYHTYESDTEVLVQAMTIGWTQNVVILETKLAFQEKAWYIRAVRQYRWSKQELIKQIASAAHLGIILDLEEDVCYTEGNDATARSNDENCGGMGHEPLRFMLRRIQCLQLRFPFLLGQTIHKVDWSDGGTRLVLHPIRIRTVSAPPGRRQCGTEHNL